jgi:uncharacterized membrane protein YkgB
MKNSPIPTKDQISAANHTKTTETRLIKITQWVDDHNLPLIISCFGIIIMLLWAGSYKLTAPGADGIVPLVTNSPLISWEFKIFGTYIGSDLIGITEITAGLLIFIGLFYPKAGIIGSLIAIAMFSVTSTMVITSPGAIISVKGMNYLSFIGLFLFKDIISLGVSFYLLSHFGRKAISENKSTFIK